VVTFNKAIAIGTGNITLKNLTDSTQSTIDITDGSQVSVSGSVLTINPTADLIAGKSYAIRIDATAVKDASGNFFAGIADDTTWNFATDATPPTVFTLSPADNATDVSPIGNLVVTFSEAVAIGTGNITLKNLTDSTQSTIAVTDGSQVSVAGSVLTINPTADLAIGKDYAIQIDPTAIKDSSGNFFAGIADDTTWNFTTWTIVLFDNFATNPNLATEWTKQIYYDYNNGADSTTATWNPTNQNLDLAVGSGDLWMVMKRLNGSTRGATDPVTLTINSASATGTDWAVVGLVISADTAPTLAGSNPRYVFILATDNANAGNWYYQVKRSPSSGAALYRSANIPYASLTFPIRLDIVRNGASYDFKVNGSTVYTASYYTSAQHDSMVYYHITWGKSALNSSMTATVDDFGIPAAAPTSGYAAWATTNAPTGTANDDYDGDGVSNGVEYVLGGDKNTNDLGKLPKTTTDGGDMLFTFERSQASIDSSTAVVIETSTDLTNWTGSYPVPDAAATDNPGVTVVKDSPVAGIDTVTLRLPRAPDEKKFARLKVTVP